MQADPSKRSGVMGLVFAEVVSAVLLLLGGFVQLDASYAGLTGGATLFLSGLIGIILSIVSVVTASGLRGGKRWSWRFSRVIAAITIILSLGLIALAATVTGSFNYPGIAIILLIVINDTIIAELAVVYFMMKPEVKALFGK